MGLPNDNRGWLGTGTIGPFSAGDRVQLRAGSKPRGTVCGIVFPGLCDVVFDHKDTLGRKRWLCEPIELEPATRYKVDGRAFMVVPE